MSVLWFFAFFFISGLCGVMYEVIWLRLAMAHFGVTTPLISIFLSIFMAGLGVGSWACGKLTTRIKNPLATYAGVELFIASCAITVPMEMSWANRFLDGYSARSAISSGSYYLLAFVLLLIILLPGCTAMGATFPLAMEAMRRLFPTSKRHFSFLYLGNVGGAILGALLPAFIFIELFGFRRSLMIGAAMNLFIVAGALALWSRHRSSLKEEVISRTAPFGEKAASAQSNRFLLFLFLTGLLSMTMEVVWIRQFTPYVGTQVYAFATILAVYLSGTFVGSQAYRSSMGRHGFLGNDIPWVLMGLAALMPLATADPRFLASPVIRVIVGIVPFTALIGFVTPMLVDCFSQERPVLAGRAYAVNLVGCIVGPLLAGFVLLPIFGERRSLIGMAVLLFSLEAFNWSWSAGTRRNQISYYGAAAVVAALAPFYTVDFEQLYESREVRRDYAATVISTGEGMKKKLIVNGIDITTLTPVTKYMAHLPLAFLAGPPQKALVICFGMGTTFRSLLTWPIEATAVELLPSVPRAFHYYHPDGDKLLQSARAHVVIDDGRLFLQRTNEQFDLITVDPPPPIEAAGSSLLYSREFYEVLKKRLTPGGILQQWTPGGDCNDSAAIAQALKASFPYVRAFSGIEGQGYHFLATNFPTPKLSANELANRLSPAAKADFIEWGPGHSAEEQFQNILAREVPLESVIALAPHAPAIEDDRAINEYWRLRGWASESDSSGDSFVHRVADISFRYSSCKSGLLSNKTEAK